MNLYKKLKSLLTPSERKRAILVFLLMLIAAAVEMIGVASILPFMAVLTNPQVVETNAWLAAAYHRLGFESREQFQLFLGIGVFAIFIGSLGLKAFTTYAITRFSFMRLHTISCRLLGAYLRQPYEFFLGRNTADLGKRVLQEVQQVTKNVLQPSMQLIASSIIATTILGLLLAIEPLLSLTVAAVLGGSFGLAYLLVRRLLARIGSDRVRANRERSIFATEALNGIKELRLLGREAGYLNRFRNPSERFARHQATSTVVGTLPRYAIEAVAFGSILLLKLVLLARYDGVLGALPFIVTYAFAGYRLLPTFQQIFNNLTQVRFNAPALDVLFDDLTSKEHSAVKGDSFSITPERLAPARQIQLDHITYYYPKNLKPAIHDLNLTIAAGKCIGIVGSTGSGKTTAVDIILGLLHPTEGTILIDGKPILGEAREAEERGQRSEVRGQRTEVRGQRSEDRGQRSDLRSKQPNIPLPRREGPGEGDQMKPETYNTEPGTQNQESPLRTLRLCSELSRTETPNLLRAWQNAIGYVPQHIYLTDDSVKANIALGIPLKEIDDVAVERAAKAAQIHDFIVSELPQGYDTIIGERGVRLSGGQRQRIGIARALYHDPAVLIFDEATSALDNLTEQAVMQAVYSLSGEKTIIIIAHRLSTVKKCSTIFLLEKGRLIGTGTYEDLALNNKKFQTMTEGIG
ncbi:MAG: ABC transporter ATP-binding protein [Candidatus Loosdrechtia sp.]|uniref:ABC transporter ATP-binding protein n=1 Tax=Candidatus Loosdrechtia sp. TaxID=3101272 RepID=UPI003A62E16C|nr:MAG: ABC transporter ATP-binding protein [Candidatus Jettenia sp. AMX2]